MSDTAQFDPPANRRAPCPCGSGKRYKTCHGRGVPNSPSSPSSMTPAPTAASQRGIYQEYINAPLQPLQRDEQRRVQMQRIGQLLDADVLSYAARLTHLPLQGITTLVHYEDVLPLQDLLSGLKRQRVAVLLETHGGAGEIGRQIVEMLHEQFEHVSFIVPGTAKSTGTIMVLGGDEIYMGPGSALGPIDAQIFQDGKQFSADALIEGLDRIKAEVVANDGKLNPAYVPILQKISPGEIQNAINALEFARATVTEWLVKYKFRNWARDGVPVEEGEKRARAREIAEALSSQSRWHTHGRSIRIPDLRTLRLKITDFTDTPELAEAIQRYQVLVRMTFDSTNSYKVYETTQATVARQFTPPGPVSPSARPGSMKMAEADVQCPRCQVVHKIQLDFAPNLPLKAGNLRFPSSGFLTCPNCSNNIDVRPAQAAAERQLGRKIIPQSP